MGIVTKLEAGVRHKDRINVFIDDEFACSLTAFSVATHRLKIGNEISDDKLIEIFTTSELDIAFNKCLDLVSRATKTEKQVKEYLLSKDFSANVVDNCIDKLKAYNFINDEKYALQYAELSSANKGVKRIRYELIMKGISDSLIDKALQQINDEKFSQAIDEQVAKFFRNKTKDYANFIKANRYLLNKGYSYEQVKKALSKLNSETEVLDIELDE